MRPFVRQIGIVLLSVVAGCKSADSSTSSKKLTVTATVLSGEVSGVTHGVKADGSNKVTIQVDGGTKAPITVTAQRGSFAGGTKSATIDGDSGSVDLTVCDARTDTACAGDVSVIASDDNSVTGRVMLHLVGYETVCNNGLDDNGDAKTDCADSDCDSQACLLKGTAGTCQSLVCITAVCVPTQSTEICDNNIDDNCDSKTDCQDSACDGQYCKNGSSTFICKSSVCTDVASGLGLTLVPKRTRLPADGETTTTVVVTLTNQGAPQANTNLTLTTDLGSFVVGSTTTTTTTTSTGSDGTAAVTFKASSGAGTATITAALTSLLQVSLSTTVTMPALGSIQIGSVQNKVMGVKYSGWNEQDQISVQILDTEQKPYPDGLAVRFQHQRLGGSSISTPWTADVLDSCLQASGCLGYLAQTTSSADKPDTTGLAYVNLYSGTVAGLVSVQVTAAAGGTTRSFTIQNIAIVGAKASGARISLECKPKNIPALIDTDCLHTFYAGAESPIECTAYFADRFNNVLGRSLLATFASEAGAAGPPVTTAQYDPTKGTDQTISLGFAANTIAVTGYSLPADVAPFTSSGELSFTSGADDCGVLTHNQRDGLVTIIVMARGEEGFVDLNGNGVWDTGEPFIDQGEPFIDANDNGVCDPGEYFVDLNGSGDWDGPDGEWSSDTTIWTETRVLYTGFPAFGTGFSHANPASVTVLASGTDQKATTAMSFFYFMDANKNPITPAATYTTQSEMTLVTPSILYRPTSVDNLGLAFTRQYCDEPPGSTPSVCASTCPSSPCYVVTKISGYANAVSPGVVAITGGSDGGSDTIDIIPTIDGITVTPGIQVGVTVPPPP